jgi:superfamily II DNA or RNA helicase
MAKKVATPAVDLETDLFGDRLARWYQVASLHASEAAFESGKRRLLIVQPTGSGKTFTSGLIFSSDRIRRAVGVPVGEKLRLLFIAHKHRLLTQAEREYADAANIEFIPQSAFSPIPPIVLQQGWHIACLDEAHHEAMLTIQYMLETLADKPILGLTATPDRADGCLIKFEQTIEPLSRQQAVEEGYLAETYLRSFVDTSGRDKAPIVSDILHNNYHEMGQTIIFLKTRAEVRAVMETLRSMKLKAIAILNQTDREVDEVLDRFSDGQFQFIVNCNMINEGVDVRCCESVLLGRSYGSYPQLNQVIGRASRPDSPCRVWELINPLSATNLDTTVVVGVPEEHTLYHKVHGVWKQLQFDYVSYKRSLEQVNRDWLT